MTSMTADTGVSWDPITARILFMTIALYRVLMPTWVLQTPPSATQPSVTRELMPLAAEPLLWKIAPSMEEILSISVPTMAAPGRENS